MQTNDLPHFIIYSDGAYKFETKKGGYAAFVQNTGDVIHGSALHTTNNRMELMGAIVGAEYIPVGSTGEITTDSKYVSDSIEKGWVYNWRNNGWTQRNGEPTKNRDLWERLLRALEGKQIRFIWVKGHAGDPGNELCDSVAHYMSMI